MSLVGRKWWVAAPAAVLWIAVPLSFELGTPIPVSFMLFFASVVLAAGLAGHPVGLVAGVLCASSAVYLHLRGIGPPPLVGTPISTGLGAILFIGTGYLLGRIRSERDKYEDELLSIQGDLKQSLAEQLEGTKSALQDLRVSEARLEQAARVAKLGYFVFDFDRGIVESCSDRHAAIFGLTPQDFIAKVTGLQGDMSMIHPDDRDRIRAAYAELATGQDAVIDYRFFREDGEMGFIREYVSPEAGPDGRVRRGVGSSIDMTAEKQTEQHLRQAQKMNAVGQLTAGVAHDFNNLLAVILGNAELLAEDDIPADDKRALGEIIRATERGSSLTRSLLSFAQKSRLSPELVDANEVLRDSAVMFRRILFDNIGLETELAGDIGLIKLDRNLLETALLNLVLNARDAMHDGGKIRLSTGVVEIDRQNAPAEDLRLPPGRYVTISVADDGHGIPMDSLTRVTEPFFTTKNRAEGSGLGLSMVQGFVQQSKGGLSITSANGDGATVTLYFPLAKDAGETQVEPSKAPAGPRPSLRALMVEDDPAVRQVLHAQLTRMNLDVTQADNGDEALGILTAPGQFDLVILDNIMPGRLMGVELARKIRAIDARVGIILQTGDPSLTMSDENVVDVWLRKPVKKTELAEAIDRAIDAVQDWSKDRPRQWTAS